jgi:hypothetical protein
MKTISFMLLFILAIYLAPAAAASGPFIKVAPPHQVTCDPLDGTQVKGVYVYWRGKGAAAFNPANKVTLTVDAAHNPPIFDLMALKLVCGDYEFAATAFDAGGIESDFSNVIAYSYVYPWCPRVPASQEAVADHLNRIEAMIRALLLGQAAP